MPIGRAFQAAPRPADVVRSNHLSFCLEVAEAEVLEADGIASAFLSSTHELTHSIERGLLDEYWRVRGLDGPDLGIDSATAVWSHVEFGTAVIRRHTSDGKLYLMLHGRAAWDDDHGVQVVLREGVLPIRFSAIDDHLTDESAFAPVWSFRRFWFEFEDTHLLPSGFVRGCGVTAISEDAARITLRAALGAGVLPPLRSVVVDIDLASLPDDVRAGMRDPSRGGVWFPPDSYR